MVAPQDYTGSGRLRGIALRRRWVSGRTGADGLLHPYNKPVKSVEKTAKIYFTDAGLCTHLLGIGNAETKLESNASGALLETFAVMETCKRHWDAGSDARFWLFRDGEVREMDLELGLKSRLHSIAIRSAIQVRKKDMRRGMQTSRAAAGTAADIGAALYGGEENVALDAETALVPLGKM